MDRNLLPYRTPFNLSPATSASSTDENNFDSLREIHKEFGAEIERLRTIDSVVLDETELTVKEQIAANQKAYDILLPLYQTLETTLADIDNKWKHRS